MRTKNNNTASFFIAWCWFWTNTQSCCSCILLIILMCYR